MTSINYSAMRALLFEGETALGQEVVLNFLG